jgi:hypothetical protein
MYTVVTLRNVCGWHLKGITEVLKLWFSSSSPGKCWDNTAKWMEVTHLQICIFTQFMVRSHLNRCYKSVQVLNKFKK